MSKFVMSLVWLLAASLLPGASMADPSAQTRSYCTTSFHSTSAATVPTFTWALTTTKHPSVILTSTAVQTITPPPVTSTRTSTTVFTSTVRASSTDVCTEVIVVEVFPETFAPATTTTVFSTVSSTLTQEAGTSTVPTPAGFLPIQSSAPNATFQNPPVQARDEELLGFSHHARSHIRRGADTASKNVPVVNANSHTANAHGANLVQQTSSSSYPFEVGCVDLVTTYQTVTSTVTASTTDTRTAAASTVTSTKVVSSTTTSTTGGYSYTTSTSTKTGSLTTVTPTSTQTKTTTATLTYKHAAATVYAQCAPNNFVNTVHGDYGLVPASRTSNMFARVNGTFSSVECCELCARDSNCAVSGYDASTSACNLLDHCGIALQVLSDAEARQYYNIPSSATLPFTLSNGCVNAISCPERGQLCI